MRKLLFILIAVVVLAIALFHEAAYSYAPLLLALAFLLYRAAYRKLLKGVNVSAHVVDEAIHITLHHRLPLQLCAQFACDVQHALSDEQTTLRQRFMTNELTIPLDQTYCGTLQLSNATLTLTDALGIASLQLPLSLTSALIWPTVTSQSVNAETAAIYELLGSDGGAREKITPYRPGDALKHIHWPLSAKLQTVVVQQHAFMETKQQAIALYFNDVKTLDEYDAFMRLCYGVVSSPECAQITVWQDDWQTFDVTEPQRITELFTYLLSAPLAQLYAPSLPAAQVVRYEGGNR